MNSLRIRTKDAFDQLTRYGDAVANEEIFEVLWKLTDINDDLAHGRHADLVSEGCAEAKRLLDNLAAVYKQRGY